MSSDRTTAPQAGDKGLAPCKSAAGIQGEAFGAGAGQAFGNTDEAGIALAQHNGHEDNIAADFTLPVGQGIQENITVTQAPERAVMWAAPSLEGSRSESPLAEPDTAGDVTSDEPAQQGSAAGAAVAGAGDAEQAQPALSLRHSVSVAKGHEGGVRNGSEGRAIEGNATEGFGREDGFPRHPGDVDTPTGDHNVDLGVDNDGFVDEEKGFAAPDLPELSDESVQENYAVVRKVRAVMALNKAERDRRKDHERSAGTTEDYEADVRVLKERGRRLDELFPMHPVCAALASYSPKKNSFYKMKSSALWDARQRVDALLSEQDKLQRAQPKSAAWGQSIDALNTALWELEQIQSLSLGEALQIMREVAQPVESKKLVFRRANNDWRELFFAETVKSVQYRPVCFLMAAVGMRPIELEKGVLVQRLGNKVGVRIEGAKVTQKSGQEWRTVFIDAGRFPAWFLSDLSATPRKYSAPRGAMRSYLNRLSPKVLTKKWKGEQLILSAYVLRHCIATDMFQDGWSTAEIAAVLGERVEDTVRHYGLRTRGAKWREPDVIVVREKVLTAVPVRKRDRSFLEQKASAKSSLKKVSKGTGRAP